MHNLPPSREGKNQPPLLIGEEERLIVGCKRAIGSPIFLPEIWNTDLLICDTLIVTRSKERVFSYSDFLEIWSYLFLLQNRDCRGC